MGLDPDVVDRAAMEHLRDPDDLAGVIGDVRGDADFANARTYLQPYSCDLLTSYSAAVGRLKAQLA